MLFDNFNVQCTESLLKLLDVNNINSVIISASCTDQLQPMDVSVNKSAKEYLRRRFQQWYAEKYYVSVCCKNRFDTSGSSSKHCEATKCKVAYIHV